MVFARFGISWNFRLSYPRLRQALSRYVQYAQKKNLFQMIKYISTIILGIISVTTYSQIQTISKNDFESANFDSLTTLQNDLKDVRIVGLGESSHIMGSTYVSKIKMVKYLHQYCGFDVIAFESPMYDLDNFYNEQIKNNNITASEFLAKGDISSIWLTDDMYELFDYILESQKTEKPLIYTGFDESLFYKENYRINTDYKNFITRLNLDSNSKIKADSLFTNALNFTAKNSYYFTKVPPKDTLTLHRTFSDVRIALNKINNKDGYYYFWERMTDNIESLYRKNYKTAYRDLQMAKNVSYLVNHKFPNKKIMLWAATLHLLEDKNNIQYTKGKARQFMGHFLKSEFKNQYYHIAFTPASGITGFKGYLGLGKKRVKSNFGSLEKFISDKYNTDYAFISMKTTFNRKLMSDNNIIISNIIGLTPYEMNINSAVDAYFYIKEEHLVSFSKRKAYYDNIKK